MATITLGPIIGKVDHASARVLVETDEDVELTCHAEPDGGSAIETTRRVRAERPAVFELEGLRPDTRYLVTFAGASHDVAGRIHTYPEEPSALNLAAVSCNFFVRGGAADLWADLLHRYVEPNDPPLHLLLHAGDQIHGDIAFQEALTILDGKPSGSARQEQEILDCYRRLYRATWRHRPTREVLARVPNLMIWNAHEIRDDWGSRPQDSDPESGSHWIGTLARRAYREYQRQLWDELDVDATPTSGFEHHLHRFGAIGIAFLDLRGGRSFERDPARPFLGTPQWESLVESLGPGATFDRARALIVVSPVPVCFLGRSAAGVGRTFVDDLRDHWSYGDHRKEQLELVRALRRWKAASPGRQVLLVGGDVHVGGHTEILHDGVAIFDQVITSPITDKPPGEYLFRGLDALLRVPSPIGRGYQYRHRDFTCRRNYAIITARIPDDPSVPAQLHAALETE